MEWQIVKHRDNFTFLTRGWRGNSITSVVLVARTPCGSSVYPFTCKERPMSVRPKSYLVLVQANLHPAVLTLVTCICHPQKGVGSINVYCGGSGAWYRKWREVEGEYIKKITHTKRRETKMVENKCVWGWQFILYSAGRTEGEGSRSDGNREHELSLNIRTGQWWFHQSQVLSTLSSVYVTRIWLWTKPEGERTENRGYAILNRETKFLH
jgi:hypothetical protein